MDTPLDALSPAGPLLARFRAWERRTRGWDLYPGPVRPEPAFTPFLGHMLPSAPADDGRRETLLSGFLSGVARLLTRARPMPTLPLKEENEPGATPDLDTRDVELHLTLPPTARPSPDVFLQCLAGLRRVCPRPLCFELVGTHGNLTLHLVTAGRDHASIASQLTAHVPEAIVTPSAGRLAEAWASATADSESESLIIECGLSHLVARPLRTLDSLSVDPLVGLCAALSSVRQDEAAVVQVLFEPIRHPWAESLLRAFTFNDGSPFFEADPTVLKQAQAKVAQPLYAAVLRVATASAGEGRTFALARDVVSALGAFDQPGGNELIPLHNNDYDEDAHAEDLLNRQCRRTGMLLSAEELAALVHMPAPEVRAPALARQTRKTKATPAPQGTPSATLGTNTHHGRTTQVTLSLDQRLRHVHLIGASGTGKSTLMLSLMAQDLEHGRGFALIDPHGDLVDHVLSRVPASRVEDVVLIDPGDPTHAVGFNPLQAHSDLEKTLLSSDLVAIFRRFSTSWGDQMGAVLANAVLAFLESPRGGTLADLRRFLIEPGFRKDVIARVQDPHVAYYWHKEFPLLSGRPQAPLLTRLDTFLRPKPVRHLLSQRESRLDLASFMDTGKVVLIKLGQGLIGEENASLLGALFLAKFHQLALGRQAQAEAARRPFFLYCDEFGSYVTPSMARLFSGVRKYKLGLVLAHQDLRQLHAAPEVESAVLANAGTRVCFRVGDQDAKALAEGFAFYEAADLRSLGIGEAVCRIDQAEHDFNLTTTPMPPIEEAAAAARREACVQAARSRYAAPRSAVEAELLESFRSPEPPEAPAPVTPTVSPPVAAPAATPASAHLAEPPSALPVHLSLPPSTPVPTAPPTPIACPSPAPTSPPEPVPSPLGKGGPEHRRLQEEIAEWGRSAGYHATIEYALAKGGSVDVMLEHPPRRIACEVSVTTPAKQELDNLTKCLAAGFNEVVMVVVEPRTKRALERLATAEFPPDVLRHIRFWHPAEAFAQTDFLQNIEPRSRTVRGYKVTSHMVSAGTESAEKRDAIARVLANAVHRSAKGQPPR